MLAMLLYQPSPRSHDAVFPGLSREGAYSFPISEILALSDRLMS